MARDPRSEGALVESPGVRPPRPTLVERERIISRLGDAFANGNLEVEEFERRVTLAHQADADRELAALVTDLPAPTRPTEAPPTRALVPERDVKATGMVLAAMGGVERRGTWNVPRRLNVVTIMGGATLDFREARLPEGDVEIRVGSLMGGVEIIVPPSLQVESTGAAIMGGFEHLDRAPPIADPGATVLRVTGLVVMGGVSIETRLPGETGRQARKRRKREARTRA